MSRLIDADIVMDGINRIWAANPAENAYTDFGQALDSVSAIVEDAPTIDPVPHGHWIDFRAHDKDWLRNDGKTVFMECSVCHEKLCRNLMLSVNYCPSCGAKMDGDAHVV